MKSINILCRRRLVRVAAGAVGTLAMIVSAHGEYNVERLDGTSVTRLIVSAGDGSVTQGTVATANRRGTSRAVGATPARSVLPMSCVFGTSHRAAVS